MGVYESLVFQTHLCTAAFRFAYYFGPWYVAKWVSSALHNEIFAVFSIPDDISVPLLFPKTLRLESPTTRHSEAPALWRLWRN